MSAQFGKKVHPAKLLLVVLQASRRAQNQIDRYMLHTRMKKLTYQHGFVPFTRNVLSRGPKVSQAPDEHGTGTHQDHRGEQKGRQVLFNHGQFFSLALLPAASLNLDHHLFGMLAAPLHRLFVAAGLGTSRHGPGDRLVRVRVRTILYSTTGTV